jgi:hypothetical protein
MPETTRHEGYFFPSPVALLSAVAIGGRPGCRDLGDRNTRQRREILLPLPFLVAADGDAEGHLLAIVELEKEAFVGEAAVC